MVVLMGIFLFWQWFRHTGRSTLSDNTKGLHYFTLCDTTTFFDKT